MEFSNWLRVGGHPYTQQPMATIETHQWQQTAQTKPTDSIKERGKVERERERERERESKRGEGVRLSLRDERDNKINK